MRVRVSYQPKRRSANLPCYMPVFIRGVHTLIAMGYARMCPADHAKAQEEEITGELMQAVEAVVDDPGSPPWVTYYHPREEARVNAPGRKGKRRRRLDIRIDSSESRPRKPFPFEAKRLGPKHGVSLYLGEEGLGCFVHGRYARGESSVGMLGYVQAGSPQEWAKKIAKAIARDAAKLHLLESSPWRRERVVAKLTHTYRSGHSRPDVGQPVEVYHTLLLFN